jgi:very-short-patch-repair endonuclease
VDFVCLEAKLVIEIDGGQHMEQVDYDQNRTEYSQKLGFRVIRYWNNEVLQELDAVLNSIYMAITDSPSATAPCVALPPASMPSSPPPSPLTGERE